MYDEELYAGPEWLTVAEEVEVLDQSEFRSVVKLGALGYIVESGL